jgi:hypothetical protein
MRGSLGKFAKRSPPVEFSDYNRVLNYSESETTKEGWIRIEREQKVVRKV